MPDPIGHLFAGLSPIYLRTWLSSPVRIIRSKYPFCQILLEAVTLYNISVLSILNKNS